MWRIFFSFFILYFILLILFICKILCILSCKYAVIIFLFSDFQLSFYYITTAICEWILVLSMWYSLEIYSEELDRSTFSIFLLKKQLSNKYSWDKWFYNKDFLSIDIDLFNCIYKSWRILSNLNYISVS